VLETNRVKPARTYSPTDRRRALRALKVALLEGATWRYQHVVDAAAEAGASDEDIDSAVHEALEILFSSAERTLTPRQLDAVWPAEHNV
jgi:hypothetical protein